MSGIYIKGMKMPTRCAECFMYQCGATSMDDCPLIPVPDHGRLIDADALMDALPVAYPSVTYEIEVAATIIPADTTQSNTSNALDALNKEADTT